MVACREEDVGVDLLYWMNTVAVTSASVSDYLCFVEHTVGLSLLNPFIYSKERETDSKREKVEVNFIVANVN
jgi:hypothetical protein